MYVGLSRLTAVTSQRSNQPAGRKARRGLGFRRPSRDVSAQNLKPGKQRHGRWRAQQWGPSPEHTMICLPTATSVSKLKLQLQGSVDAPACTARFCSA